MLHNACDWRDSFHQDLTGAALGAIGVMRELRMPHLSGLGLTSEPLQTAS
jgi:hypothetical protein